VRRAVIRIVLALLPATVAVAQAAPDKPVFEVASVKPAAPQSPGMSRVGIFGGPGTSDPGQARFENVSQRMLLTQAYEVQDYQVSGPAWLESERYDIVAKVPSGATKEQFRLMLQDLLAERFKLTLHRETKELPLYALVVAKGGSKLKEAAPPPATDEAAAKDGPGAPPPWPGFGPPPGASPGEGGNFRPPVGKDGLPKLPPGIARQGVIFMMMLGRSRLVGEGQTVAKLADALAIQLGRPVTDKTGLSGTYDFSLEFDPAGLSGMRGVVVRMPPGGGPGGGPDGPAGNPPESDAPGLFASLQQQLGLKLEQKKGLLDMLVVDHSERVPVEN